MGSRILAERISEATLKHAKYTLKTYAGSAVRKALLNGDIEQAEKGILASLPEHEWWDDKGDVKVTAVAKVVGLLISSFPQSQPNVEIFTVQMIEDVQDWSPHPFALHDACRELRMEMKFTPSIAEVHKAYQAAHDEWVERWDWWESVEPMAEGLTKLIEQKEEQQAHERQEHERKEREREAERREREAAEREAKAKREAMDHEQAEVRRFLSKADESVSVDVEMQAPYRHRVEELIDHAAAVAGAGETGLRLGVKHHESCAVRGGQACDCVPALWGIGVVSKIIFWVDEDGRVTQPILSRAEAEARAAALTRPRP
jgi:flagellar biosynthesis GTPase FlhF